MRAIPGLAIAALLVVLAVGFGVRQWLDRRRREPGLSEADDRYFAGQDLRRLGGSTLMLMIAAGMTAGTIINPRASREAAQVWGLIWLGVGLLLLLLLGLALVDWLAIRAYAGRHRRALDAERRETIEALRRHLNEARRSHHGPSDGPNGQQGTER